MPSLKELDLGCHELERTEQRRFRHEVRSVCALVARHLPKTMNEKYWKVLVLCVSGEPKAEPIDQLGVAFVEIQRDVSGFFTLEKEEKQRWVLAALREGVAKVAASTDLDPGSFEEAFKEAERLNFENIWRWKAKTSTDRRLKAEIWIEHDLEECRLVGVITTKAGERLASMTLATTAPDEFAFTRFLGKIRWEDDRRLVLEDKKGAVVGQVEVP